MRKTGPSWETIPAVNKKNIQRIWLTIAIKRNVSSEPCGNRMKSLLSVEFPILESVEDVESGKVEGESDGP